MKECKQISIGLFIKTLRCNQEYSLRELAQRSGIAISTISGLENDKTEPRVETLIALLRALK